MGQVLDYLMAERGPALRADPQDAESWARRTREMALGQVRAQVPVAVFQGDDDLTVFPAASEAYVKLACANGSIVSYAHYPGTDHVRIPFRASDDVLAWIASRLAGRPAPTACR